MLATWLMDRDSSTRISTFCIFCLFIPYYLELAQKGTFMPAATENLHVMTWCNLQKATWRECLRLPIDSKIANAHRIYVWAKERLEMGVYLTEELLVRFREIFGASKNPILSLAGIASFHSFYVGSHGKSVIARPISTGADAKFQKLSTDENRLILYIVMKDSL